MNNQHHLWLRKYIWDVSAAVALLLGFTPLEESNGSVTVEYPPHRPRDPNSRDWQAEAKAIRDLAYQAIDAGVLPCVGDSHYVELERKRVRPYEFYRWALAEGYPIPKAWHTRLRQPESPPPETAQSSQEPSQPPPARKKSALEERQEKINNILRVLMETEPDLDLPNHMPGQKEQFRTICQKIYPRKGLFDIGAETFDKAIQGLAKFGGGAQPTDYYSKHFAEVKGRLAPTKKNSSNL